MPSDLTIFAAKYLVFIEALVAMVAVVWAFQGRSRDDAWRWLMAVVVTGLSAEVFTQLGAAIFNDPRPFKVGHFHPLIPHAADNGFPSDHALLAAFLVACVLFARAWLATPIVATLAILVDWARVGAGIHHPIDVIGSSVFVGVGAFIAALISPFLFDRLSAYLPDYLTGSAPLFPWPSPSNFKRN
jgi:undecaprenyl-diphosphatase